MITDYLVDIKGINQEDAETLIKILEDNGQELYRPNTFLSNLMNFGWDYYTFCEDSWCGSTIVVGKPILHYSQFIKTYGKPIVNQLEV